MSTSGLIFTIHPDGSVDIGYEDYGVNSFGGNDCEVIYKLDKDNFQSLLNLLKCSSAFQAEQYIAMKFGNSLQTESFSEFCDVNSINMIKIYGLIDKA